MKNKLQTILLSTFGLLAIIFKTCKSELGFLKGETKLMSGIIKEETTITGSALKESHSIRFNPKNTEDIAVYEIGIKNESKLYKNLKDELKDEVKDHLFEFLEDKYLVPMAVNEIMCNPIKKNNCISELYKKNYISNINSLEESRSFLLGYNNVKRKMSDEFRMMMLMEYSDLYFSYTMKSIISQNNLKSTTLFIVDQIAKKRMIKDSSFMILLKKNIDKYN